MENLISWDWQLALMNMVRLLVAFALAFPLGWERSRSARQIGLRTFPLVAVASCGYMLIIQSMAGGDADSVSRAIQGLMAGIGFVGGGAILKERGAVMGLATATSIWNTGAIGAAVGLQRTEIAVVLMILNFALLRLTPQPTRIIRPRPPEQDHPDLQA